MTEPEARACKGGETRCVQSLTQHKEECIACGLVLDCEELDCSYFGFAADCPKEEDEQ